MDIEWFDSANPPEVIGRTPDGGFLVHTSLHPLGVTQALERDDRAWEDDREARRVAHHVGDAGLPTHDPDRVGRTDFLWSVPPIFLRLDRPKRAVHPGESEQ